MRAHRILVATILAGYGAVVAPAVALSPASAAVAPSLSSVTLGATDVVGGTTVTGTVRLTSKAGPGGTVVALSSDNTEAATVPASATVVAGAISASFTVSTAVLINSQSALIIGASGGTTAYGVLTVRPAAQFSSGSVAIIPGGGGSGTVTSQPAGIRCTIVDGNGSGACSAFFPVGTVVRLAAQSAAGSKFQGWRGLPGCGDPSKIVVARGTTIFCQPSFVLK